MLGIISVYFNVAGVVSGLWEQLQKAGFLVCGLQLGIQGCGTFWVVWAVTECQNTKQSVVAYKPWRTI